MSMPPLRKIAFLLEEFTRSSPAQQLLDRFLIGYQRQGGQHKVGCEKVSAHLMLGGGDSDFGTREDDFGLVVAPTIEAAVEGADAIVIVSRKPGALANERFLQLALERAPRGAACFVHGALCNSLDRGRELAGLAHSRQIRLLAGTPLGVTWRLPEVDLPMDAEANQALIVVQVSPQSAQATPPSVPASLRGAELHALEGLLPVIEHRRGGEAGVSSVRFLQGREVWRAGDKGVWSWPMLAAALSRSDSPQGDAVLDGRTQDLVRLGLVPRLARNPRGWILEHRDGLKSTLLVLDGVVADFNFAVRTKGGSMLSAQILRAPAPALQHFSRLAAVMEDFFRGSTAPWPLERNLLIAGLLDTFSRPAARTGKRIFTPDLEISYRAVEAKPSREQDYGRGRP
ncbi:MAG TPA: hypothetical protein VMZ27_00755 [Candidatus Saccharimonadales bacterium]|nr:hypothetical protein [Candidatus Saccharimonadales bacterium]